MRAGDRLVAGVDSAVELRLPVVVVVIGLVFGLFVVRLFQLQVLQGEEMKGIAKGNAVRLVRLEAPRGNILDREGRVLATTRPAFGVTIMPSEMSREQRTFAALGMLIDEPSAELSKRVGKPRGRRRFQPVRLQGDLSYDHLARIESHLFELPGVHTDIRPRRHYVEGEMAAHLLGQIGEIREKQLKGEKYEGYRAGQIVGQSGVERALERDLRGVEGGRNVVVDVAGRVVDVLDEVAPVPGGSVTLTIDLDLQRAAEDGFQADVLGGPEKMGAVVALDPRNGDVLALVSRPAFDPNDFSGGIDSKTWKALMGDPWRPLQNRPLKGQYPPGSTYKAFVAAAGLEKGVLDPNKKVYCPGHFKLGRRVYRCWKRSGHGDMNLRDALKMSCDVFFYKLGLDLGIDEIARFAKGFNLGLRSGLLLGDENQGLVPTQAWKERRFKEVWLRGETVSASIGQGFNLVTPIQLAVAYAAIANGGIVLQPRLILERTDPELGLIGASNPKVLQRVPVAPEHLARVRDALTAVVEEPRGTGGRSRVEGVTVAGKTGTSQVVHLKHTEELEDDEIPIKYRDHAWFAAFAPAEAAEIVVVVLVEHGGHGGSAAAPIAQKVLAKYFEKQRALAGEKLAVVQVEPDAGNR